MAFDVGAQDFAARVVERSRELPVVVDFWAAWCGPCRALTPALEAAATAREGQVELAKVDVDAEPGLAASFRVQGIPAVKAFRDGRVVDEFTGAVPPAQVEAFFDRLVPSDADRLAAAGDEASLRRALELDPRHAEAGRSLGRLLLARGEARAATDVLAPFEHDFVAAALLARARLAASGDGTEAGPRAERSTDVAAAFDAWDAGEHREALERLQRAVATAETDERDLLRRVMVGIFTELGPDDPVAREHRRRLAAALN